MRWAALLCGLCLAPLRAEVFWRQPGGLPSEWQRAYASPVKLQDGEGDMDLFATGGTLAQIEARLRKQHGDSLAWMAGENVAWALALADGWLYRYLVQPQPEGAGFWVMALRQREKNAGRPGAAPRKHQLRDIPVFPHSEPTLYVKDEGNHLAVEISMTPAAPAAVLDQLGESLKADGWVESGVSTGGLRWFLRRDRMALLTAQQGPDGNTRVLRLHKPIGVQ
jgi:hypothetical protein